jgi:hypothetical protein
LIAGWTLSAAAETVRLAWDPSTEPDVAGYRVFRGTASGLYDWIRDVGLVTACEFADVSPGQTYYFAVTAYNERGFESEPSAELRYEGGASSPPDDSNSPPVARAATVAATEDSPAEIDLTGTDPDGDPLTYSISRLPVHGTLVGNPPSFFYVPDPNFNGTDTFEFTVDDGRLGSTPARISLVVAPVNDAPVAIGRSLSLLGLTQLAVLLTASDPDGDELSYRVTQVPEYGILIGAPPNLVYIPALGAAGTDSFRFTASDGELTSAAATIALDIATAGDRGPVATDSSVTLNEDGSAKVTLKGSDPDGDPLTFGILQFPAHGIIAGAPPNLTYRPKADFHGQDLLRFSVSDGKATSDPGTITLTVRSVNDPPIGSPLSLATPEDAALPVTLSGSDADGDPLSFKLTQLPANGVLTGTVPKLTYKPGAHFNGNDSFAFTVSDGKLGSEPAMVSIRIDPVNDRPVALAASFSAGAGDSMGILLRGTDPDGDPLSFRISKPPSHGVLSGSAPAVTYRSAAGFSGEDSFEFTVSDQELTSAPGVVSIEVIPAHNRAPVAAALAASLLEDSVITLVLQGSDPDAAELTFNVTESPAHGSLSGTPPRLTYRPHPDYNGSDSFAYTASDGQAASAPAKVSLTIRPVNDPPTALSGSVTALDAGATPITLSGLDPDGDQVYFAITRLPAEGIVLGAPPSLAYKARFGFSGEDHFTFVASDGKAASAPARISISVPGGLEGLAVNAGGATLPGGLGADSDLPADSDPIEEAPHQTEWPDLLQPLLPARPDEFVVVHGATSSSLSSGETSLLANDGDSAGLALSAALVSAPSHGLVEIRPDGSFLYRHLGGGDFADSFSYVALSDTEQSTETTVQVRVLQISELAMEATDTVVRFPVAPGYDYQVEFSDDSQSWDSLTRFTSESDGLATVADPGTPAAAVRLYRVRCIDGHGESVSEAWGRLSFNPVLGEPFSVPFGGPMVRRAQPLAVGRDWVQLEGPGWPAGQLEPRDGFASHILIVAHSTDPAATGRWWPVTGHDTTTIVVSTGADGDETLLPIGPEDTLEVHQLLSINQLFAQATAHGSGLSPGDLLSVSGPVSGDWNVEYLDGATGSPPGYYVTHSGKLFGPFEGSSLTLLPSQRLVFDGASAGPPGLRVAGRVRTTTPVP